MMPNSSSSGSAMTMQMPTSWKISTERITRPRIASVVHRMWRPLPAVPSGSARITVSAPIVAGVMTSPARKGRPGLSALMPSQTSTYSTRA
ncbi:hypothetical protein HMPREF9946_02400 [Acetobacteraceae bacterium AT-5844]|nr:hypothetical protein HMPREF9946_02400 [Acetobacteraceae bacterium AT-5844]